MKRLLQLVLILIISQVNIYSQFGKNKVQYEDFEWQFIKSAHFEVYFHEGGEYLANFTAIEAEKALLKIQSQINHKLQTKIKIIVFNSHNQFQQNNVIDQFLSESVGGVTQLYKNRIVMPFQGSYKQFKHLIGHELVHGVFNDMFHGGSLQASLSQGGYFMPIWMNEGFAEYSSNNGMNTETDMFMRDLTISEYLPRIDRMGGYLAYRGGQTFYWYIAEKYGEEKIAHLINNLKRYANVDKAFKESFNMSVKEFNEHWERDIKKIFWPDLEIFENPKDFAIEVTNREKMGNFYNSSPSISPDGEEMAFISEDGGLLGVSVMEIDKPESRRSLVSSFRSQDFEDLNMLSPGISWNPEGTHLAVSAKAGGEDAVFIVDVEEEDYEKLTFDLKSIASVQWSPNGKYLAFTATEGASSDVYLYEFESKKLSNLTDDIFSDMIPVWSPNSEHIYFISDRGDNIRNKLKEFDVSMWSYDVEKNDIYKINIFTGTLTKITNEPYSNKTSIAISSDEKKMLYVSDKNGIGNIYEMDLETKSIKPKTNSLTGLTQLSLAPDGSKLLFGTQIKAGYDIFMLKFPFENDLKIDKLPLTKFIKEKQGNLDLSNLDSANTEKIDSVNNDNEKIEPYGEYEIDFSNDKLVEKNDEVIANNTNYVYSEIDTTFTPMDYKLQFTPDIVYGNPGYSTIYGVQGVTQVMFSDILGNHKLTLQANLLMNIQNSTFYGSYSYLPKIIDYHIGAYHTAYWFGSTDGFYYRFRNYGTTFRASYPFSLFSRVEANTNFMFLSKERLEGSDENDLSRALIVPELRYVYDNALGSNGFAYLLGTRFFISLKGSPKLYDEGLEFLVAKTDFRHYYPLTSWINIAFRFSAGSSIGADPLSFYLGGTENWLNITSAERSRLPFEKPEDFAFMNLEMPLRGWGINEIRGKNYFLSNLEMRFPLFQALVAGPVPVLIQNVMGAFFVDVGGAWDDKFKISTKDLWGNEVPKNMVFSSGIGARAYFFGLPIKMDVAWTNNYTSWSKPRYLFSLGFDY